MSLFTPRVYQEIMQDMLSALLANTPLTDVNFGSVAVTMLEAAAIEDDEQYFQMIEILRAFSIDILTGTDLEDRAFEYGLEKLDAVEASTNVTISDTAITKVSTAIYSGLPGPANGAC